METAELNETGGAVNFSAEAEMERGYERSREIGGERSRERCQRSRGREIERGCARERS